MIAIGSLVVGVFVGFVCHDTLSDKLKVTEKRQEHALCTYFECAKNDFSYVYSEEDACFLATVREKEYAVKFSQNQPIQVIYAQELSVN